MREIVKYSCIYCAKIFDSKEECDEHERTHMRNYADAANDEIKKELWKLADRAWKYRTCGTVIGMPCENFKLDGKRSEQNKIGGMEEWKTLK